MAQRDSLEVTMGDIEAQVKATLGWLYKIRNVNGFYEAKVALLIQPVWYRGSEPYLLGYEIDQNTRVREEGAWIQFGDSAEMITSQWQPRIGDRVIVYTYGEYGFNNGRLFRLPTSHDSNAEAAADMRVNGPFRTLSGGMG